MRVIFSRYTSMEDSLISHAHVEIQFEQKKTKINDITHSTAYKHIVHSFILFSI